MTQHKHEDVVIRVDNLRKCYRIYDTPKDRLKQALWRGRRQYYREFWALRDVSFEVKRGETLGIIGRNGSGKSTLLQMICGTLTPTDGTVQTHGRVAALLELGSGFNPEFTGRENVAINARLLGLSEKEVEEKFEKIVEFFLIKK
jgi:lipopolysaccharide transport system ATP-binding protein